MMIAPAFSQAFSRLTKAVLTASVFGAGAFAIVASVMAASAYASGYRVNLTPSMPVGLWRVSGGRAFQRGDVVWVCPPNTSALRDAHRFGYIPAGFCSSGLAPLLKPIVAVEGDALSLAADGVTVNGILVPNSAPLQADAHGNPLPRVRYGSYTVLPGEVWLVSSYNPASFDSRYFGPVSAALVDGPAAPVAVKDHH